MQKITISTIILLIICLSIKAQVKDSLISVDILMIDVRASKTVNGIGRLGEYQNEIIYAGKKTELIIIDSINANKSLNNTRQIIGRIPGLNIIESETGGFTANGIGFRGLNPIQSLEMNVRQNGYNIAADVYGYNESYYVPPMEAVERIEVVKGASSLQFGPQFGGMVNYEMAKAPIDKKIQLNASLTSGSFGLINGFASLSGTCNKISYMVFGQYRYFDGYRPHSLQHQFSGMARIQYKATDKLTLSLEYTILRNKIKMPGGLSDEQFQQDQRQSFRTRNWMTTPWNLWTANLNYKINNQSSIDIKSTFNYSVRNLVWRNEDGGPSAIDEIDAATGQFYPRELERQNAKSLTTEIRYLNNYNIKGQNQTIAAGIRVAYSQFNKNSGGEGSNGVEEDYTLYGDRFAKDLLFTSLNIAPFIENTFRIGSRFSITPGFRFEYLKSTASGYKLDDNDYIVSNENRNRLFPLFGVGLQFKVWNNNNIYANVSQAYNPITYSSLSPIGVTSKIDQKMKDSKGFNMDLGYRGNVKNILNYDISFFGIIYNDRVGLVLKTDPNTGQEYTYRTNVANSLHIGLEHYIELNILKLLAAQYTNMNLSIYNSFSYVRARYTSGEYKNNTVEYAPEFINRAGLTASYKGLSSTFQIAYQSKSFGDGSNAISSEDPAVGLIPSYYVMDWSASYKFKMVQLKAGINNLGNQKYFTQRADEYPGPGIIPSIARNYYVGFSIKL